MAGRFYTHDLKRDAESLVGVGVDEDHDHGHVLVLDVKVYPQVMFVWCSVKQTPRVQV